MEDLVNVSDEELREPGPNSLADKRAAEELGLTVDELVHIMDTWSKHAGDVAREGARRWRQKVANAQRTMIE